MTTSTLSSSSLGPRMSSTLHNRNKNVGSSLDSIGHSDNESLVTTDTEEYP